MAFWIFVGKYWLTFLFGLIAAGMTAFAARTKKLYEKDKKLCEKEKEDAILEKAEQMMDKKIKNILDIMDGKNRNLANEDGKIFARLDTQEKILSILQRGILSIHGRQLKAECKAVLESDEPISLDMYTHLQEEHMVYNNLGGNHEGDLLFSLIEQKYLSQMK